MTQNPLFPSDKDNVPPNAALPTQGVGQRLPLKTDGANPAADLIREKINRLYGSEPDALDEEREAAAVAKRSPHQQYMYDLSTSGKSLAEIQTEWHNYYVALPDNQKHQVWQEFYANNQPKEVQRVHEPTNSNARDMVIGHNDRARPHREAASRRADEDKRSSATVRAAIRKKVAKHTDKISPRAKQNFHSLMFGLGTGTIVLIIFLFGFFNEVIIAPFIQPGRSSATPIIVSTSSVDASVPSVIIPKINVQIPVVYGIASNDESVIENNLEDGVVHYPTTKLPGQKGNAAFFGHSSNNIFNKGKYKFAFVLLHKLQQDDVFYLTYNGQVYSYKVITTKIVPPSQVDVLNDIPGQDATATLITCDPPGTSLNRLVVVGQQVTPNPAGNSTASATSSAAASASAAPLPGNGPNLLVKLWRAIF